MVRNPLAQIIMLAEDSGDMANTLLKGGRIKLSPLTGGFTSDIGGLNQWMHIWAYKSLDERVAIRKKATSEGIWPPPGDSPVLKQETKILLVARSLRSSRPVG